MCKFALQLNEFARGRVKMYNLLIDGHDQFDVFEESLEIAYKSQFNSIAAYISQISGLKNLPSRKRRKLKGFDNTTELRTNDLRLYYMKIKEDGQIICLGGYKKNQKKDLNKLKSLQKQVENQIRNYGKLKKHQ